jgi:hypothetical protein
VAIPIYHEGADDAAGDAGAPSPPPAGGVDLASAAVLAVDAALKAWPVKIDRDAVPLKVAAAVALVECDFPPQLVRALNEEGERFNALLAAGELSPFWWKTWLKLRDAGAVEEYAAGKARRFRIVEAKNG